MTEMNGKVERGNDGRRTPWAMANQGGMRASGSGFITQETLSIRKGEIELCDGRRHFKTGFANGLPSLTCDQNCDLFTFGTKIVPTLSQKFTPFIE